jgi:hypothetical protein
MLKWSSLAAQLIAVIIAFVAGPSPRLWGSRHSRAGCERRCVAASLRSTVACQAEVVPYATEFLAGLAGGTQAKGMS